MPPRLTRCTARRPRLLVEALEERLALSISAVSDTTTFPFSAVVQMEIVNNGHEITCSGVMLDGTHVLTAAHCLFEVDTGRGAAETVTVFPGRNGFNVQPFGSAQAASLVVHPSYVSGPFMGQTAFDLGLVTLDRNVGGVTGAFGLLPLYPESYFAGGTINILEYPGDTFSGVHQFFATGAAQGADTSEIRWRQSEVPVEHGSSGAPVYVRNGNTRAIVGVVSELSSTEGFATRLTTAKYNWIISQLGSGGAPSSGAPAVETPPLPATLQTVGVFDPATGTWYLRNRNTPGTPDIGPFAYGAAGWRAVSGDWNGDGFDTVGVVDPATMTWYLKNANSPGAPDVVPFAYGAGGWVSLAGDWDGDGITTIGAFDPATATWYLRDSNSVGAPTVTPFQYGAPGWLPVVGDWDGDGKTTVGVVDPATSTWYLKNANSAGAPDLAPFAYGGAGWTAVVGDWDGDGKTTIGAIEPATMLWYLKNVNTGGAPDSTPFGYGGPGWATLTGDWNGFGGTQRLSTSRGARVVAAGFADPAALLDTRALLDVARTTRAAREVFPEAVERGATGAGDEDNGVTSRERERAVVPARSRSRLVRASAATSR